MPRCYDFLSNASAPFMCDRCGEGKSSHSQHDMESPSWIPSGKWVCRCGAMIEHPGICDVCATIMLKEEVSEKRREQVKEHIPARYRRALPKTEQLAVSVSKLHTILLWYSGSCYKARTLLIRGDTHTLKSTVAGSVLRHAIEVDGHDATFISAHELAGIAGVSQETTSRARYYASDCNRLVCIDDIGAALGGAPPGGGVAAQRAAPMIDIMRTRHNNGKARQIYTYAGSNADIELCFGADILARLTDPIEALCVNLSE